MKQFYLLLLTALFSGAGLAQEVRTFDFLDAEREKNWVDSVFSTLSPDERIAQLIFTRANADLQSSAYRDFIAELKEFQPGGVVLFAGHPTNQVRLINLAQEKAKVPLLISIDGEWGLGMRMDSTMSFPYQMALGAIQDNQLIYQMGEEIASQLRRMGIHINFAPVVDVNNNPKNPVINYRSFGEDRENVARKGLAYASGLQNNGVLPVAKHFPGHGDTDTDSHLELPVIGHSEERLREVELFPFKYLADNSIAGVMVAHLSIPAWDNRENYPSSISKPIVEGILRDEIGFEGLVFTDALEMKGIASHFPAGKAALESLQAGNDIILLPENLGQAISEISRAIQAGEFSGDEIEKRCRKILRAKYRLGLNDLKVVKEEHLMEDLNSADSDLINRKLIENSITVMADDDQLIPLKNLQSNKIASLSVGTESRSQFQDRLDDYSRVEHFHLSLTPSDSEIAEVEKRLEEFTTVIIGLHDNAVRPYSGDIYSNNINSLISRISNSHQLVVASFRNPYSLSDLTLNKGALLTTYFDSPLTQDLAAQVIFGGIGAKGKLPVSVNDRFPVGSGLETMGGIRFHYTIPEELGINSRELHEKIDRIVELGLDSAAYPGAQVLLAKDGKVFFHQTYGYHTYDKIRATQKDDIYDFASVTKITGPLPALMKLHDQGQFVLENNLADYVPQMKRSNKDDLDWRNILAHNARLKSWIPYWTTTFKNNGKFKRNTLSYEYSEKYSIQLKEGLYLHKDYQNKIFKMIRKSPLNEKPGYLYSGLSFYLYPWMIENKTGASYERYLKENFYHRLGAYTLTFNPSEHFELDRIVPTEKDTFFRKMQIHGVVHDEGAAMMRGVSGNAGLFGSANDLAKLMQMYQNMGEFGGERYISTPTLKKFTACQFCETGNHRGLGFDKPLINNRERGTPAPSASDDSFGHSGYTGTFTWADPETGILFVFFSNRVHPTRDNRKLYSLNIRPGIHQAVYDLLGY